PISAAGCARSGFAAANAARRTVSSSTVGVSLPPLLADPSVAPGAPGFAPPLGAGTCTFLIQQGGPVTTGYKFNMIVRPVPEAGSSLCLLGMGSLAILALRRRLGYLDRRSR